MLQPEPSTSVPKVATDYPIFFNPNICHVCKFQNNLTECTWCSMISYCSPQHIQEDKIQHREICQFIRTNKQRVYNTRDMTLEQWYRLKLMNINLAKQELNRELQIYETQMFMFAKSCVICHRQENLTVACEFCLSVNKCLNHNSTPFEHNCDGLRQYLSIYTYIAMSGACNIRFPKELINFDVRTTRLQDMPSYFQHCLPDRNITTYNDTINTSLLSYPLTLLYGLVEANLLNRLPARLCVVHLISGFVHETQNVLPWEVILHQLQPQTRLLIVIIGPNVMEQQFIQNICQTCNRNGKELNITCLRKSYSEYVHRSSYMEPDMILAFNISFLDDYQQSAILAALRVTHCPLFLTCVTTYLAEGIRRIILQSARKTPIVNRNNNFASLLPFRNFEDNLSYHNQYLIMYYDNN